MKARPFALLAVLVAMACQDMRQPTEPKMAQDPAKTISDGAHGGNPDFFFLPPMVSDPSHDPNFEAGEFNPTFAPRLTVEICELQRSPVDASGNPVVTDCVFGNPKVKFPAGTVTLQNPPDGFYQVVWHVGESGLDDSKFYRIKVLVDGSSTPFGVADIDPILSMKELRNARTGEIIPLNENSTLPIKFRIEHGGGPTLCGLTSVRCISKTITNSDPSGFQSETLDGGAGSIAGVSFPNGWLPAGGPQNVVVTIAQLPVVGGGTTTDAQPCHLGLALPQYKGCFQFTTTPALPMDPETHAEFAVPVRVAVCYELDGGGGLEKFAELWSSGPNEPAHPLPDASDAGLLGAASRNCNTSPVVIGQTNANPIVQLASAGWRHLKSGFSRVFGVKTAYAVDLGLGGLTSAFSNVSPVLTADIIAYTNTNLTGVAPGATITDTVRIVGNNHHNTQTLSTGLSGLPVTFTLTAGNGSLLPVGGTGAGSNQVIVTTSSNPIDGSPVSGGGFAPVAWTVPTPTAPGTYTYTLTANGPALGGPVTFTSTVVVPPPVALPDLRVASGFTVGPSDFTPSGGFVLIRDAQLSNTGAAYTPPAGLNAVSVGIYVSDDRIITTSDTFIGSTSIDPAALAAAGSTLNLPIVAVSTIPHLSPGLYYVGLIVDPNHQINEGANGGNNYGSSQIVVFPGIDFETYPTGGAVCNGQGACPVNDEFATSGVIFSSTTPGVNPSLCRTSHGPVGEGSNYGVSDPANADCSGWTNSGIVMSLTNHPSSVQFQVEVNVNAGLQVTGLDVTGAVVNPEVLLNNSYQDANGNNFHRVIFRYTSTAGMQTITVAQSDGVHVIDNMIIKQ